MKATRKLPSGSFWLAIAVFALSTAGCAKYEFNIVQPTTPQPIVGTDQQTQLKIDPLNYGLQSRDGRLVMTISNPTSDDIQLLGSKSQLIDPDGITHPLLDQTIVAGSSVTQIFPPFHTQPDSPPTDVPFETSGAFASNDQPGYIQARGYEDSPSPPTPPGNTGVYNWQWNGQTDIQLTLAYSRGKNTFQHSFAFHRIKK
jgi:hypothetical protein